MKLLALSALTFLTTAFAGQSARNILNEETGDFGGAAFPLREQFSSFINTDAQGHVTGYGFYLPKLSNMGSGLDNLSAHSGSALGAAMDFDKSSLAFPEEMPFEFIGLNYGPSGHGGAGYNIPHFDVHLWVYPNEFSRGIECNGTSFPPCKTTAWQAARFNNTPSQDYYPDGDVNNPSFWAATGGAHIWPANPPDTFSSIPAVVVGTYLGKVIYYEPMIAAAILANSETSGPKDFPWPVMKAYPFPGRYFTNIHIEYDSLLERYQVLFNNVIVAPETHRGSPVFVGNQFNPVTPVIYTSTSVSNSKNCLINNGDIVDGGYSVTYLGSDYCCRARGKYNAGACETTTCGSSSPLVPSSPNSFLYDPISEKCFARCVARV